jgi:hypothetical protein
VLSPVPTTPYGQHSEGAYHPWGGEELLLPLPSTSHTMPLGGRGGEMDNSMDSSGRCVYQECVCIRSVCVSGVCVYQECVCIRSVCASGVCVHQERVCIRSVCASGACVHQECACIRSVCASGVCVHQECVCASGVCVCIRSVRASGVCVHQECVCIRSVHEERISSVYLHLSSHHLPLVSTATPDHLLSVPSLAHTLLSRLCSYSPSIHFAGSPWTNSYGGSYGQSPATPQMQDHAPQYTHQHTAPPPPPIMPPPAHLHQQQQHPPPASPMVPPPPLPPSSNPTSGTIGGSQAVHPGATSHHFPQHSPHASSPAHSAYNGHPNEAALKLEELRRAAHQNGQGHHPSQAQAPLLPHAPPPYAPPSTPPPEGRKSVSALTTEEDVLIRALEVTHSPTIALLPLPAFLPPFPSLTYLPLTFRQYTSSGGGW